KGNADDVEGRTYPKDLFFAAYKGIGDVLNTGMPYLKDSIDEALKPDNKVKYVQKREIISLQNDREAQAIASMLDNRGSLYSQLSGYVDTHEKPFQFVKVFKKDLDYTSFGSKYGTYAYARVVKDCIDRINTTRNVVEKRELFLQAQNAFKSLQCAARMRGVSEESFPLNVKFNSKITLEYGRRFLQTVFDENNPKVIEQVKERKSPVRFELPKGVSPEMAVAHLASHELKDQHINQEVLADYFLVHSFAALIEAEVKRKGADPGLQAALKDLSDAGLELRENLDNLAKHMKEQKNPHLKEQPLDADILNKAADSFRDFMEKSNRFVTENKETHPDYVERFKELCSPTIAKLKKFDYEDGLEYITLDKDLLKRPVEKYEPEPYEIPSEKDAALLKNLYMTTQDARLEIGKFHSRILQNCKQADQKGGLTSALNSCIANVDAMAMFENGYHIMHAEIQPLRQTQNRIRNIVKGLKSGPGFFVQDLVPQRDMSYKAARDENASKDYRKFQLKIAKELDKIVENTIKTSKNPIRAYISMQLSNGRITALDQVVAATMYYDEQIRKNPGKTPKYSREEIEKRAAAIKDNPVYKALFIPSDAEIAQEKAYEKEYNRTLNVEAFKKAYKDKKEGYYNNVAKIPELVASLENPFSVNTQMEAQREALHKLRELGKTMDRCGFWSSRAYKNFYAELKGLARKDIDSMTTDEMGDLLHDIYKKTANFMDGRMAVRRKPEQREHFEQTLDALSILATVNRNGEIWAKDLVEKTNVIRNNLNQPAVDLKNRNAEASQKRMDVLRGRIEYDKINQTIENLNEEIRSKNLKTAAQAYSIEDLTAYPKKAGKALKLEELKTEFQTEVESASDFASVKSLIAKNLALTAVAAYKDSRENIVISEEEYKHATELFEKHSLTSKVAEQYSDKKIFKELIQNELSPETELRGAFNRLADKVKEKIDEIDQNALGAAFKLSDEELRTKFLKRYQEDKKNKVLKENDFKKFSSFDELDQELENMDIRRVNRNDQIMMGELRIDGHKANNEVINIIADEREKEKIENSKIENNKIENNKIENNEVNKLKIILN
ncbi:MAG: hypothetical protein K5879_07475, partial [Lachnospiraceae bacterium]|nr:hypothetical protein [Lachnospiraceae bacterium]